MLKQLSKYVAFSLWGTQQKYLQGALHNVRLVFEMYGKDWTPIVYTSRQVDSSFRRELEDAGAVIVLCDSEIKVPPCMWRFLAADIPDTDAVVFRDCDSRISKREVEMVQAWLQSEKMAHVIQDHPAHRNVVLAGMWGIRPRLYGASFRMLLDKFCTGDNRYGVDQNFLKYVIWPKAKSSVLFSGTLEKKEAFVGQVFNEKSEPVEWQPPLWEEWS